MLDKKLSIKVKCQQKTRSKRKIFLELISYEIIKIPISSYVFIFLKLYFGDKM